MTQPIPGFATPEGTARFRERHATRLPGHFRAGDGLWLSSIGLGTYLGEADEVCDQRYRDAIGRAWAHGVNVIDSAVNYRHQRSERSIGQALAQAIAAGSVRRDEVFLATKGGFLSFDGAEPADPQQYFQERYLAPGLVRPEDVAAGCHVMSPAYLTDQIEVSRRNLGVETIDLYYVHNPETQLQLVDRREFHRRLGAAFAALEKAAADGKIRAYGIATWTAFRVAREATDAISLEEVLRLAERAGGARHHFRAVQVPLNLAMTEVLAGRTQTLGGKPVTLLEVTLRHGLMVFSSASLLQGNLTEGLPEEFAAPFPALKTDAQRALQFVRSAPGVTCALAGMSRPEHVEENLGTAATPPLSAEQFRAIFGRA